MAPLVDRSEFRAVLKEVVKCIRSNLDSPGLTPLTAEQIMLWLESVTSEDIQIVLQAIHADEANRH